MLPTQAVINTIATAMASDPDWLARVLGNVLALVGNEFTPSRSLAAGDLVLLDDAVLTGLEPIDVTSGIQTVVGSSDTGARGIFLREPLGGFRWVAGATPPSPVVAYGVALLVGDTGDLIASARFAEPLQFAAELDVIEVSAEFGWFATDPVQGPLAEATGPVAPAPV